jgi:hypothetical protein
MKPGFRAALILFTALLLPACNGTPILVYNGPPNVAAAGLLRGSQVVPAQGTGATGAATVTVDGMNHFISYDITAAGLGSAVSAIEIRVGGPGTNGPVLFTIPFTAFPVTGSFQDSTFIFVPVGSIQTFADACSAIATGNTYLLISTTGQPTGEVRAHLGPTLLGAAILSGSQEIPPLASAGTGSASISLDPAQAVLTVTLIDSGLTGITGAQILDGPPGTAGTTALFDIATATFNSPLTVTLDSADFTSSAGAATFTDAVNLLLSGGLHIQVLTAAHATGELRGQVGPTQLNAVLTAGDVFPPNSSTATGSATVTLDAVQKSIFVQLTHNVVTPTAVTMHADDPTFNGPQIFDIDAIAGAPSSPVSVTLQPIHLILAPSKGITSFPTFVDSFLRGKTYVDVGSTGFPAGEIRGQLLP